MRGDLPTLPNRTTALLTRRRFVAAGLAATAGIGFYSNEWARHELEIVHRPIFLKNLPPAFNGFRIVQFSDIHLEEYTEDYFLRHVVAQTNALKPDLVLVTGDFISRGPMPVAVTYDAAARCAEMLAGLTCPRRYGIFGNHDAIAGPRIIRDHMENNGLPLLVDENVRIEHQGEHIYLAGLTDLWLHPSLDRSVPPSPDAPVLLMVHEPDYATVIAGHPLGRFVDLILSGHTHGGQIRIPGIRPLALPPNGKLFPHGHYQVGSCQLYVNRGIGTVGIPFRFNCPPELTEFTLRPAPIA
jgi:predicted MPP superfamily phosphohydrolase